MTSFAPQAAWPILRFRAELLTATRQFFVECGFLEVETPLLSRDIVVDRHLDPFVTTLAPDPRQPSQGETMYLQTSPEFHMKRLLAAGAPPIFQITRSFRNGESGRWHNPEFTMVEWYEPGGDYAGAMQRTSDLADRLLQRGPSDRLSYAEAFQRMVDIDPHQATTAELRARVAALGVSAPASLDDDDRDGWLQLLLTERIEPRLGAQRPVLLYDYPASQGALARIRPGPPRVAERFELYYRGIELANGYHELLDPAELRRRNAENNAQRAADGKPTLPEQSALLAAMEAGLPSCGGVALGFDRCVLLAAQERRGLGRDGSLADVVTFAIDRA